MAPTRAGPSGHTRKTTKSKNRDREDHLDSSLPGVQKIKSSLRQTRRLLAKDNLAADVRVETERRLKSLESDLAKAERAQKERKFAVKYHKIKFFERQKVCRKIKQTKKELDDREASPETLTANRNKLLSHRVDLNYILHFPKMKKYISLFPPEVSDAANKITESDTDRQRQELRQWVRAAMDKGEMDAEPELTMDKGHGHGDTMDWEGESGSRADKRAKQKEVSKSRSKGIPDDTFFEASDGEGQQSEDG